ncbi:MAG: adenylate kinase [Clostridia bacterium]|nr:adenylate kinase [Clostridia bacterium]
MAEWKRILVLGCPGSGKSTFSRKLHDITGIPLTHLDNVWWKPDGTHISREEFDQKLAELMEADKWILDGDYSRTYEARIKACDTAVFLDIGADECLSGIRARIGKKRPDMPWTETGPDPELETMVKRYEYENRPRLMSLLKDNPEKRTVILKTRKEADDFLDSVRKHC